MTIPVRAVGAQYMLSTCEFVSANQRGMARCEFSTYLLTPGSLLDETKYVSAITDNIFK